MKKTVILLFTVLTLSTAFAQFEKGRILAGGSVSFSATTDKTKANSTTTTNGKTTSFDFGPKAGYFFINNLAAGIGLDARTSTYKDENSTYKYTTSGVSVSPFVRYYLKPGIFFQGTFGGGPSKTKVTNNNVTSTTKFSTANWSLGAGYAWFLNNKVAIEPFIGYGSQISKNKGNDVKDINSSLFINIGFQIYLDTKK